MSYNRKVENLRKNNAARFNLNITDLLKYFDLRDSSKNGDVTAIISMVGEDLNAAIFKHFCENKRGSAVKIYEITPTTGNNEGKRLDRWIFESKGRNRNLYQAEIKNWCARAIGGSDIPIDLSSKELSKLILLNWTRHFSGKDNIHAKEVNRINKVFVRMNNLNALGIIGGFKQIPLLIIWEAAHPRGNNKYFYRYNFKNKNFDFCHIFSCSLYLRYLLSRKKRNISIEIPNAKRRLADINRLFPMGNT